MSNSPKENFTRLSKALQHLHRTLLMTEAKRLAAETGRELTPYELLHASLNDPTLAWLRSLSALIVEIDTLVDEAPNLGAAESSAVSAKVAGLLDPPAEAPPSVFWERYTAHLAAEPSLIIDHARIKDQIASIKPQM